MFDTIGIRQEVSFLLLFQGLGVYKMRGSFSSILTVILGFCIFFIYSCGNGSGGKLRTRSYGPIGSIGSGGGVQSGSIDQNTWPSEIPNTPSSNDDDIEGGEGGEGGSGGGSDPTGTGGSITPINNITPPSESQIIGYSPETYSGMTLDFIFLKIPSEIIEEINTPSELISSKFYPYYTTKLSTDIITALKTQCEELTAGSDGSFVTIASRFTQVDEDTYLWDLYQCNNPSYPGEHLSTLSTKQTIFTLKDFLKTGCSINASYSDYYSEFSPSTWKSCINESNVSDIIDRVALSKIKSGTYTGFLRVLIDDVEYHCTPGISNEVCAENILKAPITQSLSFKAPGE